MVNLNDDRISATFGNPAYLASWLLLAIFFFVTGIFYLKDKYVKESLLTKIRTVIGMILITLVLPLLIKAYLFKNILLK